ncbi:MAG: hypothetical protein ACOC15_01975 [Desulfovibrionales bacterium]
MNGAGHSFELGFRFAGEADAGLILELVRELAACEELSHEEVIAGCDGQPAGFSLFFHLRPAMAA